MKVVEHEERTPNTPIDYNKLADYYNRLEIGGAVEMDQVYNITLFKEAVERRGIRREVDFLAFNRDGKTIVKRESQAPMNKD
jgi:hypothetical protein